MNGNACCSWSFNGVIIGGGMVQYPVWRCICEALILGGPGCSSAACGSGMCQGSGMAPNVYCPTCPPPSGLGSASPYTPIAADIHKGVVVECPAFVVPGGGGLG